MVVRKIALCICLAALCLHCTTAPRVVPSEPIAREGEEHEARPEPEPRPKAPRPSPVVGAEFEHVVQARDTLTGVGARYGVDARALLRMNGLGRGDRLEVGQRLRVANFHIVPEPATDGILINVPQRMLFLFRGGGLEAAFPVGLGRPDWPTPIGTFQIASRERDKVWIVPPSIQEEMKERGQPVLTRVEPGPDNPLGGYWLGLDREECGIHGTLAPASVYAFQSHGCIRMHRDDIDELFDSVGIGEEVRIIYRPVMIAMGVGGVVLLEAHPDVYQRGEMPMSELRALADEQALAIDWAQVRRVITEREGTPQRIGTAPSEAGEQR